MLPANILLAGIVQYSLVSCNNIFPHGVSMVFNF